MNTMSWIDACKLKRYCQTMVENVNASFENSDQQIICLLIAPTGLEGMQSVFNKFLITLDNHVDEQFSHSEDCTLIAVIRDESSAGKPYYFYKTLDNILAYNPEDGQL